MRKWVLSSRAVTLSYRVSAFSTRPGILWTEPLSRSGQLLAHWTQTTKAIQASDRTTERLSWGFVPFSVSSTRSPLNPGLPHPARSALRVSHPPSGFLLPAPPEFISPRNAPGIRPSELSPPKEPYASRRPYPPAVLPPRPNPWLRTPTLPNPGFNSVARNDFRVLLSPGARSHRQRV